MGSCQKIRGYYRESPDQFLLTGDFFVFASPAPYVAGVGNVQKYDVGVVGAMGWWVGFCGGR
jgi:hypothetical protein